MKTPDAVKKALTLTHKTLKRAHAPYSKFRVGATVIAKRKQLMFAGCNVENAAYGPTICAERVAILKAVSEGCTDFSDLIVMTELKEPFTPCGECLQVMAEFFAPTTRVWLANPKRVVQMRTFVELFPFAFGPATLARAKKI